MRQVLNDATLGVAEDDDSGVESAPFESPVAELLEQLLAVIAADRLRHTETGAPRIPRTTELQMLLPALADALGVSGRSQDEVRSSLARERQLIANELHDALAQSLTSIRMRTSLLRQAIESGDCARAQSNLSEVDESLAVVHARVRELITHFRMQMDSRGLVHALTQSIDEMNRIGSLQIALDFRVADLALSAEQEQQVYCIVREALTNALKHSQGRRASVTFARRDADYEVTIEDDGIGLDATADGQHGHFGLNIMRERALRLGGRIELSRAGAPAPLRGTRLRLRFPVAPLAAGEGAAT